MIEFSNGFLLSLSLCLDIGIANIAMITWLCNADTFMVSGWEWGLVWVT